ncbi:putative organ specific protein [Helianthus annuus]|uniref:Organ specific protein n=1 Tax=Helianthus annuus TaxID=4232 RepID=A0A251S1Z9_HELAN|nr:organ-specific protein P4 [Helianthus annuus]KAF5761590.1 putative organ specific protein [Helianthus annuus]KAJ0444496.1 putative organ specific protein [Helianthus annuus]
MRSFMVFLFLFSVLLNSSLYDAREGPKEYWRSVMKDEPMPKTIQDALSQDSTKSNNEVNTKDQSVGGLDTQPNHKMFQKDFDTKPNVMNYFIPKPPMSN